MLYFNENVRYRKEDSYILLCDCKRLLDFEIPLEFEPLLLALKYEYNEDKPIGIIGEKDVISDLINQHLVIQDKAKRLKAVDIWNKLSYSESEFHV